MLNTCKLTGIINNVIHWSLQLFNKVLREEIKLKGQTALNSFSFIPSNSKFPARRRSEQALTIKQFC